MSYNGNKAQAYIEKNNDNISNLTKINNNSINKPSFVSKSIDTSLYS